MRDNRASVSWVKMGGQMEGEEIMVEGQVVV